MVLDLKVKKAISNQIFFQNNFLLDYTIPLLSSLLKYAVLQKKKKVDFAENSAEFCYALVLLLWFWFSCRLWCKNGAERFKMSGKGTRSS